MKKLISLSLILTLLLMLFCIPAAAAEASWLPAKDDRVGNLILMICAVLSVLAVILGVAVLIVVGCRKYPKAENTKEEAEEEAATAVESQASASDAKKEKLLYCVCDALLISGVLMHAAAAVTKPRRKKD